MFLVKHCLYLTWRLNPKSSEGYCGLAILFCCTPSPRVCAWGCLFESLKVHWWVTYRATGKKWRTSSSVHSMNLHVLLATLILNNTELLLPFTCLELRTRLCRGTHANDMNRRDGSVELVYLSKGATANAARFEIDSGMSFFSVLVFFTGLLGTVFKLSFPNHVQNTGCIERSVSIESPQYVRLVPFHLGAIPPQACILNS